MIQLVRYNRQYRLMWAAMTSSRLGDVVFDIALMFTVYHLYHTVSSVAGIVVFQAVPWMALSPVMGIVADKIDKKTLLIAMDVLRAVIVGVFALHVSLWVMYGGLFLMETCSATYQVGRGAVRPELFPTELPQVVAVDHVTNEWITVLGPFLSGLILYTLGPTLSYSIDAASFVVSAFVTSAIVFPASLKGTRSEAKSEESKDAWSGIRFLGSHPWPLFLVLFAFGFFFSNSLMNIMTVVLVGKTTFASPILYGAVLAAQAAGTVGASIVVGNILRGGRRRRLTGVLGGGMVGAAALVFIPSSVGALVPMLMAWAVYGAGEGAREMTSGASFAQAIPLDVRGRVYGVTNGLLNISPLLAAGLTALLGGTASWGNIFRVDGLVLLIGAAITWVWFGGKGKAVLVDEA